MNDLAFAEIVTAHRVRLATLAVRCACGHALGAHAIASPHGCGYVVDDGETQDGARASCACVMFQAAEPELGQQEET